MATDKFNFDKVQKKLQAARREALVLLSHQAENYFVSSFTKQGFNGQSWQEVQRRTEGTNAYKYPKDKGLQRRTSPILVGAGYKIRGGTLRRAVSNMANTAQIGDSKLRMIVDLDYAKYNNEGGKYLPKRQFIGQTQELTEMQLSKIKEITEKIWK